MRAAYLLGKSHFEMGHSIHYNPFVHVGSGKDYCEWERGWKEANESN